MTYLEENPVSVYLPDNWTLPLVFSSPHSGDHYSPEFIEQSRLSQTALRQSEDFSVHHLFKAVTDFGAPLLHANFPRAFCDVNREAYELDPDMFDAPLPAHINKNSARVVAGIGTIPKMVSADTPIYDGKLKFAEAEHRINTCYFPYHDELNRLLTACKQKFGFVILIDCHSMPGNSTAMPGEPQLADVVLGNRFGRTCPAEFTDFLANMLGDFGYSVSFNAPYAGGYITRHYAEATDRVHCLQIELSRDLYMDPGKLQLNANADKLVANIHTLLGHMNVYFKTALVS